MLEIVKKQKKLYSQVDFGEKVFFTTVFNLLSHRAIEVLHPTQSVAKYGDDPSFAPPFPFTPLRSAVPR